MSKLVIDAQQLRQMLFAGAKNLEDNKDWINDLNVFPVPDGDTGTNMTLTVLSAVREVQNVSDLNMENLAKAISSGSLRGARGNSGVIMSQLFRGFTKEIKERDSLDKPAVAAAFARASEIAYKAVMKPKEGTILTVARGMAEKAGELCGDESMDLETFFSEIIKSGDVTLEHTPELLPVLKQAGVVDSGGQGLMVFLKGAYAAFTGQKVDVSFETTAKGTSATITVEDDGLGDIKYGYCTEFLINAGDKYNDDEELHFKAYLESIGDCVVVVSDDDIVKVHVHTNDPGLAIQKGLSYGSLSRMKIDNMREEHEEKLIRNASAIAAEQAKAPAEHKEYGFVVVAAGSGLANIIKELGANAVIEGGQTMNPSTDDFVKAVSKINADKIFILPNNKNIILAAEQSVFLVEDKKLIVVPTTTVPQGITAMLTFDPDITDEENLEAMKEAIGMVKTGQVTYAVRDTNINGTEVHENDIMGIGDHSTLLAIGRDINRVSREMVDAMTDEDSGMISIYYGENVTQEEAENLASDIGEAHPDCDVELHSGGQPVYYYVISVE
ncbi:MAG: DAK2 domain-containing protein [Lachnospiraceae bacterium]|nr:DAK2 domain-containing protein [Lachnospiraceae bacterium]